MGAELKDPGRFIEVLQAVLSEVGDVNLDEIACFLRQQHLTPVPGRCDACSFVYVVSDVALLDQVRSAGVDAHAHADLAFGERVLRLPRRLEGAGRGWEGDEEGVPLRIDLDATVAGDGLAQDVTMLPERLCIPVGAQLVQELRRPLHVGEQEGDSSGR